MGGQSSEFHFGHFEVELLMGPLVRDVREKVWACGAEAQERNLLWDYGKNLGRILSGCQHLRMGIKKNRGSQGRWGRDVHKSKKKARRGCCPRNPGKNVSVREK